jgi:type III secretory pathway component EscV
MCMTVVAERLAQLRLACPDLVDAVQDRYTPEWISAVGRALFREEIQTPSLKDTLEHLLDLGEVGDAEDVVRLSESAAATARPATGSLPPPRDVVSYLRQRSNEKVQDTSALSKQGEVLMLGADPKGITESVRDEAVHPREKRADIIVDAARRQIASAPGKVCLAVTSVPVRSLIRELLEPEFPLVPVVATQEFGVMGPALLRATESAPRPSSAE